MLWRQFLRLALSFALIIVLVGMIAWGTLAIYYSNLISWLVAVTGSYVMNSMTTFAAESGRKLRLKSYVSFLVAQVAGLIANTVTIYVVAFAIPLLLHLFVGPDAVLQVGGTVIDPVLVGKVLAIGASFLVNFTLSHFVVFRRREEPTVH